MRSRLLWLAPAAIAIAAPSSAVVYLDETAAQSLLFAGQRLTPLAITLDAAQVKAIRERSGVRVENKVLRVWRASGGGWLLLDQVLGKHEYIDYAVALDATGGVLQVEILQYREAYGEEVRRAGWRAHFHGKHAGDALQIEADVPVIAGATLSCKHVTDGVRRLLATYAVALAAHAD